MTYYSTHSASHPPASGNRSISPSHDHIVLTEWDKNSKVTKVERWDKKLHIPPFPNTAEVKKNMSELGKKISKEQDVWGQSVPWHRKHDFSACLCVCVYMYLRCAWVWGAARTDCWCPRRLSGCGQSSCTSRTVRPHVALKRGQTRTK